MKEFGILSSVDSLSEEQIITYLFSSNLSSSVKKIICDEVNKYEVGSERLEKIKAAFVSKGNFSDDFLDMEFCPIEIKKAILDEIYNGDFLVAISSEDVSLERKKLIIDLRLSTIDAIDLLKQNISIDLENYIINSRFKTSDAIISVLKDDDVPEAIREKIVIRNINISNVFNITAETPFSITSLIMRLKRRDIDDYFDSLTSDNIIPVITDHGVKRNFFEDLFKSKYNVIVDAIKKADNANLRRVIRLCDDSRLNRIILEEREEAFLEVIRSLEPVLLLPWLNLESLSSDMKDYLINYHREKLDAQISEKLLFYPEKYLRTSSYLPVEIENRVFEVCKNKLIAKFKNMSNADVVDCVICGEYGDLLLNLLIDVAVNETNIFTLLSQYSIQPSTINKLFERKEDIFKKYVSSLELFDILSLDKFNFNGEIKNRILDVSNEVVSSRLNGLDREILLTYLKNPNVLFSVKKRIMEHFGIFEIDLQNSLETLNLDSADLLINYYKDIKSLITIFGLDFQSFLQYGTGSKKYSNWLIDLTNIIKERRIEEFMRVKNYFFNNYYSDSCDKENDVSTISNFLELLGNFYRYNDLCINLVNSNKKLSNEDKASIQFLFNVRGFNNIDVPCCLEEVSSYKERLYEGVLERISNGLDSVELKNMFNELVFCNANVVLESIGGTGALVALKKDNSNSDGINLLIDELIMYSKVLEMVNDTNNTAGLSELLEFIFSDVETLTIFQNLFSQFEKKVTYLYEVDAVNHLTVLSKVRGIPGVINHKLSLEYGGEVYDFSDKNYTLYAHILSPNESIDDRVMGRVSGKRNFISVSPVSYKGQKYYYDNSQLILLFDSIPKGSYVCSSIYNMGTNHKLNNNSCEVDQFSRTQRGILESSAVYDNNSETLLFAEGLRPCALALPGGRKPTPLEMQIHEKYNLPFVITQDIDKSIDSPKMIFNNNDCLVRFDRESIKLLRDVIGILEPNVELKKETNIYTGREIALFTDSHSMYEPTLAVLEDIRRHGISEIYSLGDNIGDGPNPVEVFDLMNEYGVITIAGNSEFYNTLGLKAFPYVQGDRVKSQDWTRKKLGDLRIKQMEVFSPSIDLIVGGKKLALCHFINDIRWNFDKSHNAHTYQRNYPTGQASIQFLYTNSEEAKTEINEVISKYGETAYTGGYVSAKKRPLFDGKAVTDYDAIIQGHVHFDMSDKLDDTSIYTLRAIGMGYRDDYNDTACYYVLKEKKDGDFDVERRLVTFNRNNLISNIYTSDLPDKSRILEYVKCGRDRNGF